MTTQSNTSIVTPISTMFGIRYPIFCAPMFLVSDENMVVAAGEAGGLGCFPALNFRPISRFREAIETIRKQTRSPFGINIIVHESNRFRDEQIDVALELKTPLFISSLGNPKPLIDRCRGTGARVFCDVIHLDHAKKAADCGADGLVAVGSGAGGHAGDTSLFALIPYLKEQIGLPILAAGSIAGGAGMAAALALGADGIYLGTRFIASRESPVSEEYKQAILSAGPEDIVNTDRVDGFPGNFIRTQRLEDHALKQPLWETAIKKFPKIKKLLATARAGRSLLGSQQSPLSYKNVFSAGHGVGLIHSTPSIAEIMNTIVAEYQEVKSKLA